MAKSVMYFSRFGVRAVLTPLLISLLLGPSAPMAEAAPTSTAGSTSTGDLPSATYTLPAYTQQQLPVLTSCDPKKQDSGDDLSAVATGNSYLDALNSTAGKLNKTYGKSGSKAKTPASGDDAVDESVTIDTDCDAANRARDPQGKDKLGVDKDGLQCATAKAQADGLQKILASSKEYLACKRGVLGAIKGEIGCFKKQIASADQYENTLVNGPGGLSAMLKQGNDQLTQIDQEVQDRQSQYDAANDRIEGGPGGNPPGLRQAKDKITELSSNLTTQVTQVNQQVQNLRLQQARFETMVNQLVMGRAMDCMNTPVPGYACIKDGTTSAKYASGAVSPLDYVECIYAQSANRAGGNGVVTDSSREDAYLKQAKAAFTLAASKTPSAIALPDTSDPKAFAATMKIYTVNTPSDLLSQLSGTLASMQSATGKNITAQFTADINRCYNNAKTDIANERMQANSPIKLAQTQLQQSFDTARAANSKSFRAMRDTYAQAVKAATGQSVNVNTSQCEAASLEDQAKCFDAFNSLSDSLLTGKVVPTASSLTGPAFSLTNGQPPIHGFTSSLPATNNTARTIAVMCAGLDDCLTKYSNLRTQLKQTVTDRKAFKETFKGQINSQLLTTAKQLAATGFAGAAANGAQSSPMTLNGMAAAIQAQKTHIGNAMAKLNVEAGLDLDSKEVKEPAKDENGLYKPADLKNLIQAEVSPPLPDSNAKGFTDATKSVTDRDSDLAKLEQGLDTDFAAVQAKIASCAAAGKTLACDKVTQFQQDFCKTTTDATSELIKNYMSMAQQATAAKDGKTAKIWSDMVGKLRAEQSNISPPTTGQTTGTDASATTSLTCATAPQAYATACGLGDAVTDAKAKGDGGTGKAKGVGQSSGNGD